jgi:hypothetical protein
MCVCVCEREREGEGERFLINRFLQALKLMEAQKTCLIIYVHILKLCKSSYSTSTTPEMHVKCFDLEFYNMEMFVF